jgi:hypothetical protein
MKILSLIDDLGHNRVIVGRNQGVSIRFITSLQLQKNMCKGCKMYAILSLNEKGDTKRLEEFLVVSKFPNFFLEELPGIPSKRKLEFIIDLKPRTKPISRTPYQMSTPKLQELKMQLKDF